MPDPFTGLLVRFAGELRTAGLAVGSGDVSPALLGHTLTQHWSVATALAFLAWYVFAPQCASTLGVVKRETNSWRWPLIMLAYMTTLAYLASLIVYHGAVAFGLG